MRRYLVREVFDTFQGEGLNAGRRAVFVRFAGCNLWSGHERGRATGRGACASWCDTDFVGGERMTGQELEARMAAASPARFAVLTGGEPLLQVDADLLEQLRGWEIAIETNGTEELPAWAGRVHVTVSPKRSPLPLAVGTIGRAAELKVVVPGDAPGVPGWSAGELQAMRGQVPPGAALWIQPQDGPRYAQNAQEAARMARELGEPWRVSAQGHKLLQLP